jgi:hypothetical protein
MDIRKVKLLRRRDGVKRMVRAGSLGSRRVVHRVRAP